MNTQQIVSFLDTQPCQNMFVFPSNLTMMQTLEVALSNMTPGCAFRVHNEDRLPPHLLDEVKVEKRRREQEVHQRRSGGASSETPSSKGASKGSGSGGANTETAWWEQPQSTCMHTYAAASGSALPQGGNCEDGRFSAADPMQASPPGLAVGGSASPSGA